MKDYKYVFDAEKCWYKDKCEHYRNEKICNSTCQRYLKMSYLMAMSGIPPKRQYNLQEMRTPKVDKAAYDFLNDIRLDIRNFVENGENLYIYSDIVGNGKTTWAIRMMCSYFNTIWNGCSFKPHGLFIHTPGFLTQIKNNISFPSDEFERYLKSILEADLVVWDDVSTSYLTEFDNSQLLTYIDNRIVNGKSNIFTGNLDGYGLYRHLGARLGSRIWDVSETVEFMGMTIRGIR